MTEKNIEDLIELIYPYFEKKMISSKSFKNTVKRKNAVVTSISVNDSNIGGYVDVKLPYDNTTFSVRNETGVNLNSGDLVCLEYSIDLKNAIAVYKVN